MVKFVKELIEAHADKRQTKRENRLAKKLLKERDLSFGKQVDQISTTGKFSVSKQPMHLRPRQFKRHSEAEYFGDAQLVLQNYVSDDESVSESDLEVSTMISNVMKDPEDTLKQDRFVVSDLSSTSPTRRGSTIFSENSLTVGQEIEIDGEVFKVPGPPVSDYIDSGHEFLELVMDSDCSESDCSEIFSELAEDEIWVAVEDHGFQGHEEEEYQKQLLKVMQDNARNNERRQQRRARLLAEEDSKLFEDCEEEAIAAIGDFESIVNHFSDSEN